MYSTWKWPTRETVDKPIYDYNTVLNKPLFNQYKWIQRALKYREGTLVWGIGVDHKRTRDWANGSVRSVFQHRNSLPLPEREIHTVILEDGPIHGYIDLEFLYSDHPEKDLTRMINSLFRYIAICWAAHIPHIRPPTPIDFVVYNASSVKKASVHIHGPFHCCFKNVFHWKAFMKIVSDYIATSAGEGSVEAEECFVKSVAFGVESLAPFIDMMVYNHQVSLRCYGCVKRSEPNRILKLHEGFELPRQLIELNDDELEFELFLRSVVMAVSEKPVITLEEFVELPEEFGKRNKKEKKPLNHSFFIHKITEKSESLDECTHICVSSSGKKTYHRTDNFSALYSAMVNDKGLFIIYERFQDENRYTVQYNCIQTPEYIIDIVQKLDRNLRDHVSHHDPSDIIILRQPDKNFRFVWTNVEISREYGISITNSFIGNIYEGEIINIMEHDGVLLFLSGMTGDSTFLYCGRLLIGNDVTYIPGLPFSEIGNELCMDILLETGTVSNI
eukprot:TRINITY_DN7770_c0_g1_i1.p1 TRINITY_DN7770_c0_g1~~TRINITY_DN7770_c0_g1_i1.p1  ORF type:complete len:502 (-),score=69.87 TRINITY_DN7770_c0_g1_i1:70-1575(-)